MVMRTLEERDGMAMGIQGARADMAGFRGAQAASEKRPEKRRGWVMQNLLETLAARGNAGHLGRSGSEQQGNSRQ